jgi:hypothetical protein
MTSKETVPHDFWRILLQIEYLQKTLHNVFFNNSLKSSEQICLRATFYTSPSVHNIHSPQQLKN